MDLGFDDESLFKKFKNMACSPSYRKHFDRCAIYFPTVYDIIQTDSVAGGADTIRAIVSLIKHIYSNVIDSFPNGDLIHSAILATITHKDFSSEELIAADVFIFFTINECGIFNEKKYTSFNVKY